ncbi:Ni/Fe hydrogenase [Sulfurifustis variabilis]|uniref:hydrogenase (acceptor) n=1 Tax=Sulfurifustis variabilis TaxID=1675686 RepID=A0A1B4V5B3_9GAMM|nr:hydrogenase small subunit [Sulfurifustis variabilis]BAU48729.1 Ni/Fe hydrogenase [Sulfurifustis variabilis]
MPDNLTLGDRLGQHGISRRTFLKFCASVASAMALPPGVVPAMAEALAKARRPSVVYLSFQECTGCLESLTRAHTASLETLIFDLISLDYQHTIMAPSGDAAEASLAQAIKENDGKYLVLVDGAIPMADAGYGTVAGHSFADILRDTAKGAAAVISVGTCAAYGGLPKANPNPTGAVAVSDIVKDKPIVNVPGCPPIPVVLTGVIAHYLTFGTLPELDHLNRPKVFFADTIHDRCYRRPFYDQGKFAKTFDDEGARRGWCLYELGCKGPTTYNACATVKWNGGVSFPIESGHGCIGCSEPNFWDKGSWYTPLSAGIWTDRTTLAAAAVAGAAVGVGAAVTSRMRQRKLVEGK